MSTSDLPNKTILITGANSGIGKATALELARMGHRVVMAVRNPGKGEAARKEIIQATGNQRIDLMICDLASLESIRSFASAFTARYDQLDVLINNAGIFSNYRRETTDGFEYQLGINHLGHFLLTHLLLNTLIQSAPSRIVVVTSLGHVAGRIHFGDFQMDRFYDPWKSYFRSKLANVLFTYELADRLNGSGVTVNCLHPGVVRSRFAVDRTSDRQNFIMWLSGLISISPRRGAETSVYLATSPEVEKITGKYFVRKNARPSSKSSYDKDLAKNLWAVSEKCVGLI